MVYLCDFACWRPPPSHAAPIQRLPWGAEFDAGSSEEVLKKHPAVSRGSFFLAAIDELASLFSFFQPRPLDLSLSLSLSTSTRGKEALSLSAAAAALSEA